MARGFRSRTVRLAKGKCAVMGQQSACLADVPEGPMLGRNPAGVLGALRTPEPGQLYKYHLAGSPAMGPTALKERQISRDHARAIAETGGAIGIWHFFPSLEKYVDGLKGMVDVV